MNSFIMKQKQKEDARKRAATNQGNRKSSQASATAQNQLSSSAPQVYQAPTINTPENLHDMAKLVHNELNKIQQSQSIILSIVKQISPLAINEDGSLTINTNTTINGSENVTGGININGVWLPTWISEGEYPTSETPWNARTGIYTEINAGDSSQVLQFLAGGGSCPAMQFRIKYANGGIGYRSARDSVGFEHDFTELATTAAVEQMRLDIKKEIYAELALAGFIVPIVEDNAE